MANIVKVKQVGSLIGKSEKQRNIVLGLGLRRINHIRTLQDTPSVRGMIQKVHHLVQVVE